MFWPNVLDEEQTLDRVIAGESIARFGDGEINLIFRGLCKTQRFEAPIGYTLQRILSEGKCLVGIPRQLIGPKADFWKKYWKREVAELLRKDEYGSAFITRPDSAPWIDTPEYWKKVKSIWEGKRVCLVRGSDKSLTAEMLRGSADVKEIIAPAKNAYASYDRIYRSIGDEKIVLLCLGATATILAAELALEGRHAIDLGHIGMFLGKHERGEKMIVTAADKKVDAYA